MIALLKTMVVAFGIFFVPIFLWEYAREEYTYRCKVKYQRCLANIKRLDEWHERNP